MRVPILLRGKCLKQEEGGRWAEVRTSRLFTSCFLAQAGPNEKTTAHTEFIAISFCEVLHGFPEDGPYWRFPDCTFGNRMCFLCFDYTLQPSADARMGTCNNWSACVHAHQYYRQGIAQKKAKRKNTSTSDAMVNYENLMLWVGAFLFLGVTQQIYGSR